MISFKLIKNKTLYGMNEETIDLIIVAVAIIGIIILGVIFFLLSRWSRKKNTELEVLGVDSQMDAFQSEIRKGLFFDAIKAYFSGSISKHETFIGKFLAVLVIIFVLVFLVFAIILLISAI